MYPIIVLIASRSPNHTGSQLLSSKKPRQVRCATMGFHVLATYMVLPDEVTKSLDRRLPLQKVKSSESQSSRTNDLQKLILVAFWPGAQHYLEYGQGLVGSV